MRTFALFFFSFHSPKNLIFYVFVFKRQCIANSVFIVEHELCTKTARAFRFSEGSSNLIYWTRDRVGTVEGKNYERSSRAVRCVVTLCGMAIMQHFVDNYFKITLSLSNESRFDINNARCSKTEKRTNEREKKKKWQTSKRVEKKGEISARSSNNDILVRK